VLTRQGAEAAAAHALQQQSAAVEAAVEESDELFFVFDRFLSTSEKNEGEKCLTPFFRSLTLWCGSPYHESTFHMTTAFNIGGSSCEVL
jgi:hypothetical protein